MKVSSTKFLLVATATVAASLATSTSSHAAAIIWGPATTIAGNSDVRTNGTLVGAYTVGDAGVSGATVNGVNFLPFAAVTGTNNATAGNFNLSTVITDFFISDNSLYGSSSTPFSNLSAAYQTILASSTITAQPTAFSLTMAGLIVGARYEFQWWSNTSGPGSQSHNATAVNGVTLIDNTTGLEGGVGQYAVGRFIADISAQTIQFSPAVLGGGQFAQLNAFQLRNVPANVPDSGNTVALFGLALIGLFAFNTKVPRTQQG